MIKIDDVVKLNTPVGGVDHGVVMDIDGAYITIGIRIRGRLYPIERYPNEVEVVKGLYYEDY